MIKMSIIYIYILIIKWLNPIKSMNLYDWSVSLVGRVKTPSEVGNYQHTIYIYIWCVFIWYIYIYIYQPTEFRQCNHV